MTAKCIEKLLALRHDADLFVPQCKNGSTHYSDSLQILDAWAMAKSWKHPKYTGYEIKCSRQDFLRDDKWRGALPLCNEFYWVCVYGIVAPEEIAPETGLIVVSKTGSRLFVKRRAPYREIEPPLDLITYVLMCRTQIRDERVVVSKANEWRDWLAKRDSEKELGYNVSKKIRTLVESRITAVAYENETLREEIKRFTDASVVLKSLSLLYIHPSPRGDFARTPYTFDLERKIREAIDPLPRGIVDALRECANKLERAQEKQEQSDRKPKKAGE